MLVQFPDSRDYTIPLKIIKITPNMYSKYNVKGTMSSALHKLSFLCTTA